MNDFIADWRKWTPTERSIAKLFVVVVSGTISALWFLGLGNADPFLKVFR